MVDASVVPNRCRKLLVKVRNNNEVNHTQVVFVLPLEAHLQVMVLDHKIHEPVKEVSAFILGQSIDLVYMLANGKHALPACNWVCSDDGVSGSKVISHILRRASGFRIQSEFITCRTFVEQGLRIRGSQSFEELLIGSRDPVKYFVARCPESIYTGLGKHANKTTWQETFKHTTTCLW